MRTDGTVKYTLRGLLDTGTSAILVLSRFI